MTTVMSICPLRTKSSGLYRHREDLGLHKVGYKERNLHIRSPSLPSTPKRVPSGHECSIRSSYLHSPSVRPMANRPDARGPLSPALPQYPMNLASMTRSPARGFVFGIARRVPFFPDTSQWSSNDRVRLGSMSSIYLHRGHNNL